MLWPGEFRQEMFAELSFCFNSVLVLSELSLIDWNVVSRGLVGLPSTIFATVTFPVTVFSSTATSRNPLSSYFSESTVMVFFPLAFSLSWDWDESAYCDASINSIRSGYRISWNKADETKLTAAINTKTPSNVYMSHEEPCWLLLEEFERLSFLGSSAIPRCLWSCGGSNFNSC